VEGIIRRSRSAKPRALAFSITAMWPRDWLPVGKQKNIISSVRNFLQITLNVRVIGEKICQADVSR